MAPSLLLFCFVALMRPLWGVPFPRNDVFVVPVDDDNAEDADEAEEAEDSEDAEDTIYAVNTRDGRLSFSAREVASDAGDDSGVEDTSGEADNSGETEESGGEASGAEDVDDATETSALMVILGANIHNNGVAGGAEDATEAGHAGVSRGTGDAEVVAKASDGEDSVVTANYNISGAALAFSNVHVGGKAVVVKHVRDPRITLSATDAPYDAYPSDAADASGFPEKGEEKKFEEESLSSSGGSLLKGKFCSICLCVIPCFVFNKI